MDEQELKNRTKAFTLRILKMVDSLPKTVARHAIASQLIRSGSSVAANYRAACICRSKAEFIAKLGIVLEETDESCFWLEIIMEGGLLPVNLVEPLHHEGEELRAIFISSIRSAKTTTQSKITNLKSKIEAKSETSPTCPSCGKPMKKRKSAKGTFWGCADYPDCTSTRPYEE